MQYNNMMDTIKHKIKKYEAKLNYYLKLKSLQTGRGQPIEDSSSEFKKGDIVKFVGLLKPGSNLLTQNDILLEVAPAIGMRDRNINDNDKGKQGRITNIEFEMFVYIIKEGQEKIDGLWETAIPGTRMRIDAIIITVEGELNGRFFVNELELVQPDTPFEMQKITKKHESYEYNWPDNHFDMTIKKLKNILRLEGHSFYATNNEGKDLREVYDNFTINKNEKANIRLYHDNYDSIIPICLRSGPHDLNKCLEHLENEDLFQAATNELPNMHPALAKKILNAFQIGKSNLPRYDARYNAYISDLQSYEDWEADTLNNAQRFTPIVSNIIKKNNSLKQYLKHLIGFDRTNPAILNENSTVSSAFSDSKSILDDLTEYKSLDDDFDFDFDNVTIRQLKDNIMEEFKKKFTPIQNNIEFFESKKIFGPKLSTVVPLNDNDAINRNDKGKRKIYYSVTYM
jgi:hypothetical protein